MIISYRITCCYTTSGGVTSYGVSFDGIVFCEKIYKLNL